MDDFQSTQEVVKDQWYYPEEITNDLKDVDLPPLLKDEILAAAWEYSRCIVPQYTNWTRYIAFLRLMVIGAVAEFRGELTNVIDNDDVLGYNLSNLLEMLFRGTQCYSVMAREFRCFLLFTSLKSSRTESVLFNRYIFALSKGPRQYFRMRDNDALIRFTIAAALACNDLDTSSLTEDQLGTISEIGATMYDAVAFWKHRAEGETNNLFAYAPEDERVTAYQRCRDALWALDVVWSPSPAMQVVTNYLRPLGGPILMLMRRYRFVEEGLTLGERENNCVIDQANNNHKLWNRLHTQGTIRTETVESRGQYSHVLDRSHDLLFDGLAGMLEEKADDPCAECSHCNKSKTKDTLTFGGLLLCPRCKEKWRAHLKGLHARINMSFPKAEETLHTSQ